MNIRADRDTKLSYSLRIGIPENDVSADDVAANIPAWAQIDTVDVTAEFILLNQIELACADKSQTEIVAIDGGGSLGGS